jgi:hypothetical protein
MLDATSAGPVLHAAADVLHRLVIAPADHVKALEDATLVIRRANPTATTPRKLGAAEPVIDTDRAYRDLAQELASLAVSYRERYDRLEVEASALRRLAATPVVSRRIAQQHAALTGAAVMPMTPAAAAARRFAAQQPQSALTGQVTAGIATGDVSASPTPSDAYSLSPLAGQLSAVTPAGIPSIRPALGYGPGDGRYDHIVRELQADAAELAKRLRESMAAEADARMKIVEVQAQNAELARLLDTQRRNTGARTWAQGLPSASAEFKFKVTRPAVAQAAAGAKAALKTDVAESDDRAGDPDHQAQRVMKLEATLAGPVSDDMLDLELPDSDADAAVTPGAITDGAVDTISAQDAARPPEPPTTGPPPAKDDHHIVDASAPPSGEPSRVRFAVASPIKRKKAAVIVAAPSESSTGTDSDHTDDDAADANADAAAAAAAMEGVLSSTAGAAGPTDVVAVSIKSTIGAGGNVNVSKPTASARGVPPQRQLSISSVNGLPMTAQQQLAVELDDAMALLSLEGGAALHEDIEAMMQRVPASQLMNALLRASQQELLDVVAYRAATVAPE